ncbi:MAG: hypothetical protein VKJ04_05600 [Vampirovibrionales bacterium]|nr:hypothetical protein [Vampirovibrionales bacterium]
MTTVSPFSMAIQPTVTKKPLTQKHKATTPVTFGKIYILPEDVADVFHDKIKEAGIGSKGRKSVLRRLLMDYFNLLKIEDPDIKAGKFKAVSTRMPDYIFTGPDADILEAEIKGLDAGIHPEERTTIAAENVLKASNEETIVYLNRIQK